MGGYVIGEAVRRAKVEPGEVEDVVMGCAMQQGTTAMNVARKGATQHGLFCWTGCVAILPASSTMQTLVVDGQHAFALGTVSQHGTACPLQTVPRWRCRSPRSHQARTRRIRRHICKCGRQAGCRLDSERFRATPRTCGRFQGILSLR